MVSSALLSSYFLKVKIMMVKAEKEEYKQKYFSSKVSLWRTFQYVIQEYFRPHYHTPEGCEGATARGAGSSARAVTPILCREWGTVTVTVCRTARWACPQECPAPWLPLPMVPPPLQEARPLLATWPIMWGEVLGVCRQSHWTRWPSRDVLHPQELLATRV